MAPGGGGRKQQDPRPISDKEYMKTSIHSVINYLTEHHYDRPIAPRVLSSPTTKDFVHILSFLLKAVESSHWHRVDADEVWHHYAGAPLELRLSADGKTVRHLRLGCDFDLGETPQIVVPRGAWQAARSLGNWTLVGCTVAPGFDFAGFEMAPPGWQPSG